MRGCVFKKRNRWYVALYDKNLRKYKWHSTDHKGRRFETEADAHGFANKESNRLMQGGSHLDSKLTVQSYLDRWLETRKGRIEETTSVRYGDLIRLHVLPTFGAVPVTKLTPLMVDKFYADKLKEGRIGGTTLHQVHAILHKAFRDAVKKDVVDRNVFDKDKVDAPRITDRVIDKAPWDFEQVKLFLAQARRSSKWYLLYLFTLCTASRESEVVALQRSDLDLVLGEVHFRRKMYRLWGKAQKKKCIEGTPKSRHGIRDIPLLSIVVEELRKRLTAQDALRATFGNTYSTDGGGQLVFCQPNGKFLHIRNLIARDFNKVIERAKLPRIRFHDLKHCTASYLVALGVDIHTVSVICGHSSSAFTSKQYVHTINGTMREAMKRLESALSLTQEEGK